MALIFVISTKRGWRKGGVSNMAHYTPPTQRKFGQIIDVLVLLVLALGALYVPLWFGLAGSSMTTPDIPADVSWDSLGQNATMIARWQELGFATAADAAPKILSRFDYSFNWLELMVMIVVIVGYFTMMVRLSEHEYRQVIAEKFGDTRSPAKNPPQERN